MTERKTGITPGNVNALRDLKELLDEWGFSLFYVVPDDLAAEAPRIVLYDHHANPAAEWRAAQTPAGWSFGGHPLPPGLDEDSTEECDGEVRELFAQHYSGAILETIEDQGMTADEVREQFALRWNRDILHNHRLRGDTSARDEEFGLMLDMLRRSRKITSHCYEHTTLED